MPKINRIRIMNFSYNNDTREIPDETLQFYDGENALLNLANGGGKTVLIQLFMQPILPDLKLQKRRMIDYFRRNSAPAYVMIEWLLDNPAIKDYLMTGIAIAPGNSSNMEESNRINYFTFASHYQRACEFDLELVPFVRKEGERQVLLPFERARESVKKLVGNHREMFYFGREDVGEYRKLLGQFGISQEEWKNIIARMNNDEGGITELFEKCSTADSVLNEWVIKNIEKSQLSGQAEDTAIQELLAGLVADMLKNEEYIQAQKIIQEYLEEQQNLEKELEELCKALDGKTQIHSRLNGMYHALGIQAQKAKIDREEAALCQEDLFAEKLHIDQEEASEIYSRLLEEFLEAVETEQDIWNEAENLKKLSAQRCMEKDCQEGAGLLAEIRRLRGKMAALRRQMEQEQGDTRLKERMKDLAYSLKILSEKRCLDLENAAAGLMKEIDGLLELRGKMKAQEKKDRESWGDQKTRAGALRNKVQQFEKEQEKVFERLGFSLYRNVLEQLDGQETEKYRRLLEKETQEKEKALLLCRTCLTEGKEREKSLGQQLKMQKDIQAEMMQSLKDSRTQQRQFLEEEARCEADLEKYGIDKGLLYMPGQLRAVLQEKLEQQKAWNYQARSEHRQITEMILGIQNHCVYLPDTFLAAMDGRDISYQTGEAYLQNLPEENRRQQLLKNPMLPFGLILEKRDMGKLDDISFQECYLRQMIPVFTYEQLDGEFLLEHQRVCLGEQAQFITVYEEQLFADAQKKEYLGRLEVQRKELEKLMKDREEEEQQLIQAKSRLEDFNYPKGTREGYEVQVHDLEAQLEQITQKLDQSDKDMEKLEEELEGLAEMLPKRQEDLKEAKAKESCYEQFLAADAQYQTDLEQYARTMEELKELDKRRQECERLLEESRERENYLREQCIQTENAAREAKKALAKYAQAGEATLLDEDFGQMEQEYQMLTARQEQNYAILQKELEETGAAIRDRQEKQSELEAAEELYADLEYQPERIKQLKREIKELEEKREKVSQRYNSASNLKARIDANKEHARNRLRELGLEKPLEASEIRQDYERRRKNLDFEMEQLREKVNKLRRLEEECGGLQKRIRDVVPAGTSVQAGIDLDTDMEQQFLNLKEGYRRAQIQAQRQKKACAQRYQETCNRFIGKNQCVEDILSSLSPLHMEDPELTYESVYFYLEEFMLKRENLQKLLDFYSGQLETFVRTRNQVIDQCVSYGTGIYDEIKAIASKSRIRLSQKSRAVQMLKIDVPRELDNKVRDRMEEYMNRCLQIMVELSRKEETGGEKKMREKLSALTSGRELLNQVIGTNKIPVLVYKIDLNEKNSGLRRWEDAMAQNSGGEKFVVFFTLASTLISYIREVTRKKAGGDPMEESKVLIMDNPFARTSSEHLLKAVMDIARTFRIQLICLSDLSQSSITNRFSLFYQLSIRKRMYSDKEVLKSGPVQINKTGIVNNERLEHLELYGNGVQGTLWEEYL